MMDPRDQAFLATCPVVAAPRFGPLPAMAHGQRVIVARNGWFLQTRLDWLDHIVTLGAAPSAPPLPYGEVREHLRLSFGVLPIPLFEVFITQARQHLPDEVAGVLVHARSTGRLRLALCEPLYRSPVRIDYRRPVLATDETVAVDLHTHGYGPAFWSAEDDRDDQGIHIAGVYGRLDETQPTACFRLVVNGLYLPLERHPWQRAQSTDIASSSASAPGRMPSPLWHRRQHWTRT
jgi:PRTRC genetic system protein A